MRSRRGKMMKFGGLILAILGLTIILASVCGGVWVGIWWALIGGIIQVIEAAKCDPIESGGIAYGVARVIFASAIGWGTAILGSMLGVGMVKVGLGD